MNKTIFAALALVTASIRPAMAEIISASTLGPDPTLPDEAQRLVVEVPWDGRTRNTGSDLVHDRFWDYQVRNISDGVYDQQLELIFKHTGRPHNDPGDQDEDVGFITIHVSISTVVFNDRSMNFYRTNRTFDFHPHTPLPNHEDHAFAEICRDTPNASYIRLTLWHVPAPGALALMALGGALAARRRR